MKRSFLSLCLLITSILALKGQEGKGSSQRATASENLLRYIAYRENSIALINATVLDGRGNPVRYDQTLIIENGHFRSIGESSGVEISGVDTVLDLKGKTIIPGIVGVHNHLHIPQFPFLGEVAAKLYLAAGVTTIQTCGAASPYEEIRLAKEIARGESPGPDIVTSGPYFTGEGGNPNMIIPESGRQIEDTIAYWVDKGVRWFKVYRHISPGDLAAIIKEAHRWNAKVTGHLCSVTFEQASLMGIDGIEHGLNSTSDFRKNKDDGVCNGSREYMDELDIAGPEVKRLQQLMIDQDVFLTSTLAIYESSIPNRAYADERTLKAMSPYLRNQYRERRNRYDKQKEDLTREQRLKRIMAFEYQFHRMGGLLGSGVDAGRHVLPGYGDQRNFELFIETGFTPEEAVQVMTGNGAKILDRDNIGTIEAGKRADFVILNGDLKKDKSVIKKVEYVFKSGIGYDPGKIIEETHGKVGLDE